ncbi:MAG: VIT domain-containing protein, partial [Pseudomonadota bacterium]
MRIVSKWRSADLLFKSVNPFSQFIFLFLLLVNSLIIQAEPIDEKNEINIVKSITDIGKGSLLFKQGKSLIDAPQLDTEVEMQVSGMINRVNLKQTFSNTTENWQEGIYVFPLPEDAAVDQMRLRIGERVIEGEIQEKKLAKKIYEQAKNNGQRAALTEQERPNIFMTSVANIPSHETVIVEIEYQQLVKYDSGLFSLRFPMVIGPRYIPGNKTVTEFNGTGWAVNTDQVNDAARITPPVLASASQRKNRVTIKIDLDAGLAIEHIDSPYH